MHNNVLLTFLGLRLWFKPPLDICSRIFNVMSHIVEGEVLDL